MRPARSQAEAAERAFAVGRGVLCGVLLMLHSASRKHLAAPTPARTYVRAHFSPSAEFGSCCCCGPIQMGQYEGSKMSMSSYTMSRMMACGCAPLLPFGRQGRGGAVVGCSAHLLLAQSLAPNNIISRHAGRSHSCARGCHTRVLMIANTRAQRNTYCGVRTVFATRVRLHIDALARSGHGNPTEGDVADTVDELIRRH